MNRINTLQTSAVIVACSPIDNAYPPSLHPLLDDVCGRTIVSHIVHAISERVDSITLLVASADLGDSIANVLTDEPVTVVVGTLDEFLLDLDLADTENEWLLFYDARIPLGVESTLESLEEHDTSVSKSLWMDTSSEPTVVALYVPARDAHNAVTAVDYPVDTIAELSTIADGAHKLQVVDVNSWDGDELQLDNARERMEISTELRLRLLESLVELGVHIVDPYQTYVDVGVTIGSGTTLHPGTHLLGATEVGENCAIGPYVVVRDSTIHSDVKVGPFAHIRPGSTLEDKARIGNFVELKNTYVGAGSSAGHLSYLGDATIGAGTNIGAGTITCNYDGYRKHRTTIGANAFIGSASTLVAPVAIGTGAWTAAGSTITGAVPSDALGIGRARQSTIENWAKRRRAALQTDPQGNSNG
jgi:bifunctional N-acetylglucosamine-1-phosphate-uridyltransferase/glucosamine-1-phosphate-acetyltransferase GlmU-like protein